MSQEQAVSSRQRKSEVRSVEHGLGRKLVKVLTAY